MQNPPIPMKTAYCIYSVINDAGSVKKAAGPFLREKDNRDSSLFSCPSPAITASYFFIRHNNSTTTYKNLFIIILNSITRIINFSSLNCTDDSKRVNNGVTINTMPAKKIMIFSFFRRKKFPFPVSVFHLPFIGK